mmetsp:Transcript_13048/g.45609  ORF Transcript_13048/g.45609 Transcript_13048/m.45609 type:complete len:242 (-) Transcript_13048:1257-1982(-)
MWSAFARPPARPRLASPPPHSLPKKFHTAMHESSPTLTTCRSSGLHATSRTRPEWPSLAASSVCRCTSKILTWWSSEHSAMKRPEGDTLSAFTRDCDGSCIAITGASSTSQSQKSSLPSVPPVTSSCSWSLRWLIAVNCPTPTLLIWWPTMRRSSLRSYVNTQRSLPAECTRCGATRSGTTATTGLMCSVNCSSSSRERRSHTATLPSSPPVITAASVPTTAVHAPRCAAMYQLSAPLASS